MSRLLSAVLILLVALAPAGCNRSKPKVDSGSDAEASAGTPVAAPATAKARGQAYRATILLPGATVMGFETTQIRAKVGGYVAEIGKLDGETIDLGSEVEANTLLARLDTPETLEGIAEKDAMVEQARSALTQADAAIAEANAQVAQREAELEQVRAKRAEKQATLDLNEKKHERLTGLVQSGAIGTEALDEVEFAVAAARAALQSVSADEKVAKSNIVAAEAGVQRAVADKGSAAAHVKVAEAAARRLRTMLDYASIRAPFKGMITKRMVDHGSFVQPADNNSAAKPLFEITRIDHVRVVVGVPNNKLDRIADGQKAIFHGIGGLAGHRFEGTIARVSGALDARSRTMPIEVDFRNPVKDLDTGEEATLKPGMYGTLTIIQNEWTEAEPLAVVPTQAVATDAEGRTYVVIVDGGQRLKQFVEVVFNDAINVGISSGVVVGTTVALEGL